MLALAAGAFLATPAQAQGQAQNFGCNPPESNAIVCENSKPGTPESVWRIPWQMGDAGDPSIQGFASDISVNHGETVSFKVKTDATSYRLDIYRMGYYNGKGARLITTVNPSASLPQAQPACISDPATKLYDCGNWGVSGSWAVPANAPSGIYFAKATRTDTGGFSHIIFIVRDDQSHSAILYKTSDESWQAYNDYGGYSLYGGPANTWDISQRAYKVSYNRPFNTNHVARSTWLMSAEYPMVRWMEANGYDVSYFTNVDGARNPALILDHKLFVAAGHDEYWSGSLRTAVEAARDAGVNLAFFSGNEVFWKTRWESSIDGTGTPYRTLVCYKETWAAARLEPGDSSTWTGTWRDPNFSPPADGGRPENALTGTIFAVNSESNLPMNVPAEDGKMRFWRNTSLAHLSPGQTGSLPLGTLGYEWDIDDDNGFRPAGLFHLSTTTAQLNGILLLDYGKTYGSGTATHHLTLYRAPSGALVFGAGTVQWSWGLEAHDNPFFPTTPPPSTDMRQATVNLFADMGVQPATLQGGLVPASQSSDAIPPISTVTSPAPAAVLSRGVPVFITGTAADAGGGVVGGVEVSADGGQSWHPAVGRESWAYAFTPSQAGTLTLMSRAADDSGNIEIPGAGISVTIQGNYAISGIIQPASAGSGATVTLSGPLSQMVTANASGDYSFSGLPAGNYTIIPSREGYSFGPASQIVTVSGASLSEVNFTAGQSSTTAFSIAGSVGPLPYGSGVTITLAGALGASTITDAAGNFSFAGVPDGAYSINPSKTGFLFSPNASAVTVADANVAGMAFTATPSGETLFTTQIPAKVGQSDGPNANYELGTQFLSATAGSITAIRFWKESAESGTHAGKIWSSSGDLLASVLFANETASGWQQQALDEPIFIPANTTYVVSVNTGNTFYVATNDELATPVVNGNLRSVVGNNGLFGPPETFPTNSYASTNYYRDIVFVPSANATLWYVWADSTRPVGGSAVEAWAGLTGPAPEGGAVVTLWSDNAAVSVPASVTISAGSTEAPFTIQTGGVSSETAVNVVGIYNQWQSTTLSIRPAVLSAVSVSPGNLVGGSSATGTATLNGWAPPGGATVALLSDSPAMSTPPTVTIPGGASSVDFAITTQVVGTATPATLWASYSALQSAALTINPAALSSLSLSVADVTGGSSSTATATLSGPAPPEGAVVTLSSDDPVAPGILSVHSADGLPPDGSIDWLSAGPASGSLASGSAVPLTGIPGAHVTMSTFTGAPLAILTNCPGNDCGWLGNFAPGAALLWVGGTYSSDTGWWAPNGPLTLTFDSPQHGLGFQVMADEAGNFTATLCAYNAGGTLLGCVPFNGNGTGTPDGSAVFAGIYDDAAEISRVTIDAGGALYPHDFAISNLIVAASRIARVPVSVTVPAGATTASFPVNTIAAGAVTTAHITGTYQAATQTAALTIRPPVLAALSLTSSSVAMGDSTTATVALSGPAPAGGVVVTLSSDDPLVPGIQSVSGLSDLSHDGSVVWTDAGPSFTEVASGAAMPVSGRSGLTLTVATASGHSPMILTNCPAAADCGWVGNFVPAAPLLWTGGTYDGATGSWTGHGPLSLTLSSPQRGLGFNIMADEAGPFTVTLCAYRADGQLLGCLPYSGNASFQYADGTATYVGVYDDAAEISRVTIDAGGTFYPHDFAIGSVTVAATHRTVPPSVTVPAGATTASFLVNTDEVGAPADLTISGSYGANYAASLAINH